MNFDRESDFEQSMAQLVQLLKKIIKNLPGPSGSSQPFMPAASKDTNGIQVNLCFFNFLPMSAEEMADLEEAYEEALFQDDKRSSAEDLTSELNTDDLEFLRRHGIRF